MNTIDVLSCTLNVLINIFIDHTNLRVVYDYICISIVISQPQIFRTFSYVERRNKSFESGRVDPNAGALQTINIMIGILTNDIGLETLKFCWYSKLRDILQLCHELKLLKILNNNIDLFLQFIIKKIKLYFILNLSLSFNWRNI